AVAAGFGFGTDAGVRPDVGVGTGAAVRAGVVADGIAGITTSITAGLAARVVARTGIECGRAGGNGGSSLWRGGHRGVRRGPGHRRGRGRWNVRAVSGFVFLQGLAAVRAGHRQRPQLRVVGDQELAMRAWKEHARYSSTY